VVGLLGACPNGYDAREVYEDHSSGVVKLRDLADDDYCIGMLEILKQRIAFKMFWKELEFEE